ncbi:MAG: endo-1,4-beta-xylanase [Phycisphaerae bacterium]|nr:endo-1,4-beta-xylanase [Phycisphaerae bacterium]
MLRFDVYKQGRKAQEVDLAGAYVFGQDAIPVRADLTFAAGLITCAKRVAGACGLSLLWETASGTFMLPTTRLCERNEPYILNVELARGQMMRIAQKIEEWGLFDFPDAAAICAEFDRINHRFVESLHAPGGEAASLLADRALAEGVTLGEKMALFHAEIFLGRKRAVGAAAPRLGLGCVVDLHSTAPGYQDILRDTFEFISVPLPWKHIEPRERDLQYAQIDNWVAWAARSRRAVHAGPLLSFEPAYLPQWLFLWENDYETLRDLIYEHIQRIVKRYEKQVRVWNVVSGLNAYNGFNLTFEQVMELTRMSCFLVKKLSPRSQVVVDLAMPWGEYYSRNQKTIPPLMYADMAVQSGIRFDSFGIQMYMGVPVDGYYVRDLLQISAVMDEFVALGKPLHISACQVPGDMASNARDAWGGQLSVAKAGQWHQPWNQRLQAEWLQAFYRIALSKPYVESVTWRDLADTDGHYIPHGGLCRDTLDAKLAYRELKNFRGSLMRRT